MFAGNPTTLQAWEQAKSAAAAWGVARGIYYPQVDGSVNYGYGSGGGSATGLDPYDEQFAYAGLTLNYLLLDFGGRSAQSKAAQQALFTANWNHNQVIQDVLRNVAVAFYNYIGNKAQVRADEVSLNEAQTSLESAELRLEAGVGTLPDVLQAKATMAQVQFDLVSDQGAVQTSRGELATVIGWPANTAFDVSGEPEELPLAAIEQNVEDLIAVAKQNRPELAAVQAFVERRQAELREAKSNLWPQLSAIAQISRWWVRPEGSPSDYFTNYPYDEQFAYAGLTLKYLLLDFGGRSAQSKAAQQALFTANWNHNQVIQDVLRNVAVAFYNYIGNKAQVRADEVSLNEAQTSLESAELRLEAGVGTLPDVLQAKATMAQVQFDLVSDQGAVQTSRGELATVIGWPANTAFDVSGEPEELPLAAIEQNVEDLIAVAKQNRPELAAVQAFVERRQAELREAKSNLWPQLSAIAQISRWWVRPDGSSSDYFTNYLFGLQLQFPIFQGFALINSVREARSDLKAARAALLLEEQVVIEDVWNAYYNFRTAAGQLEASEVLLASSKESFDASLARFRSGVGDIVELLNAQTLLAEARAEKIKATTSLFTSFAELVHALGAELPEYNNGNIPEINQNASESDVIYEEE